ncbi:MAG: hypothetical protein JKX81_05875 [Arenicella sp.]|nr:hypothetical protein [Arenicella sp.]
MKNSAWNPARRNRNIGTSKSGYSQNNKFVIPERWVDFKIFWERLVSPVVCPVSIKGHKLTILVEPPALGSIHSSTPQDIIKVLGLVTQEHLEEIDVVVLRQPKRKEEILKPAWGRFIYYADLGKYSGPGVYLEAMQINSVIKWGNKLTPFYEKESRALEADGHKIEHVKRGYDVMTTPQSVRSTQLFRTLPHEIGHAVDYLEHSLNPSIEATTEAESDFIRNTFSSKPTLDKEEYANRYAKEFYDQNSDILPFDRIFDEKELESMGLNPKWFEY